MLRPAPSSLRARSPLLSVFAPFVQAHVPAVTPRAARGTVGRQHPPPRAAGVPASPGVCPRGSVRAVRAGKQAAPLPGFQMDCGRVCRRRASSRDGPPPVLQVTRVSLFRPLPLWTALVRFVTAGRRCRPGTRSVLRGFPCASRAGAQSAEYFYGRCASAWSAVFSYLFTSYSWRSGVSIAELHETANEGGVCAVF